MSDITTFQINIDRPYLTVAQYAEKYGVSPAAVRKRVQRGQLPVRPRTAKKSQILINEALLLKQALSAKY